MASRADHPLPPGSVLIEAEAFTEYGGWVLDQQFMDQMGSPFLLAHGLGTPVADATTTVSFQAKGAYRLWVRTRDWAAPRVAGEGPGRFRVIVGGNPVPVVFGVEGAGWHWQDGGTIEVREGPVRIALHDETGFEGRADALFFSPDPGFTPPEGAALAGWRRRAAGLPEEPADGGSFDLVVAGGGIPGMCAAVAAARLGLKVALVQDRPVLGGNNSSEIRVWLGGETNLPPYPKIGNLVLELEQARKAHYGPDNTADLYEDDRKIDLVRAERNATLLTGHHVVAAEPGPEGIGAVVAEDIRSGRRTRMTARLFADCTGDGALGALAGADFEVTAKGHMGPSNLWHISDTGKPSPFPACPWATDLSAKPFPGRRKLTGQYAEEEGIGNLGAWFWENGFDLDPVADAELIRDRNFLAMYGAWDALKNVDGDFPNHRLIWASYLAGKRESRRLLGDVVLTRDDVVSGRGFDDACFPCTWVIDLHYPHPGFSAGFEGREFISEATHDEYASPYWAPYRCLYSRNVPNLFMAGRDLSVTHEALGVARVMRTGGMMGEVVALAASLCVRRGTTPRGVFRDHLPHLIAALKAGVPAR